MIHILPPDVANRIAAGEVVERPASVVRELVDNSIDAGATRIDVEVEDGGIALLRVADNGSGMSREDTVLCVKRHATSKIRSSDDLSAITTKGFRGEALAAISSVSQFEIKTRRPEDELGTLVRFEGGMEHPPKDTGTAVGTVISVRDLFYNVPARRKFLKKPATELSAILATITWSALAQERIHFTFTNNGRRTVDYPAVSNRPERIQQIFGKDMLGDLIPLHYETPAASLTGFISRPTLTRNNSQNIYFFVNDRYIKDRLLHSAMMQGYRSLIPHGRYPVVFLYYEIEPSEIDINVHPTKQEIKFSREDAIFSATYRAIRQAWDTREDAETRLFPPEDTDLPPEPAAPPVQKMNDKPSSTAPLDAPETPEHPAPQWMPRPEFPTQTAHPLPPDPTQRPSEKLETAQTNSFTQERTDLEPNISKETTTEAANQKMNAEIHISERVSQLNRKPLDLPETGSSSMYSPEHNALSDLLHAEKKPEELFSVRSLEDAGRLHVRGQLLNSYILAESEEGLYIIDQHAAHERLKFEEFLQASEKAPLASQAMLFPLTVDFAPEEIALLEENNELLMQFGFQVEPFGPRTFAIQAVPSHMRIEDAEGFIRDLLAQIQNVGDAQERHERTLHTMACRAAVKFGDTLAQAEMEAIVRGLECIPRRNVCPHGRPSILFVADNTLRRLFKRLGF